ncbi:MAG: C1 family peptidase [Paramuribaculum sp.]|nr:C1 family peptidase [Paramuribaculum sp.]MDE6323274.1 C1 family peptidase [Paramuribaculum sp.]
MNRHLVSLAAFLFVSVATIGADNGGISAEMLGRLRSTYGNTPADKALRNAMAATSIDKIATNANGRAVTSSEMSHRVRSRGITDQKSSGRCWLFTGLNVLRSQMMARHDLPELKLSQSYNFFYDQLEKSNLFLQSVIETASEPMDNRRVQWLFQNPLSDGGQYTGLSDNIMKYGVVPAEVMEESFSANNTSRLRQLLSLKLREDGLSLRRMAASKAGKKAIAAETERMLGEIYRILALTIGTPPEEFEWTRRDSKGNVVDTRRYTPREFYQQYAGNDLKADYVMLMNDPTRPYHALYEIDLDRHSFDGQNWTYINLPMDEIKKIAIESIKDSTMMYFSCDVGKFFDRDRGLLDLDNYDYESLLGTSFSMDKADRIRTYASASSHAMTLVGVDLGADGSPRRWLVENSWGSGANDGHLVITDRWMDEYMFRLVVDRKYVPGKVLDVLKQKPVALPAWDPMFSPDQP